MSSKIYDAFVKETTKLAVAKKVGDPFNAATDQGPQIDQEMFNKVMDLIESGKAAGATVETGGAREGKVGFFIKVIQRSCFFLTFENILWDPMKQKTTSKIRKRRKLTRKFMFMLFIFFECPAHGIFERDGRHENREGRNIRPGPIDPQI